VPHEEALRIRDDVAFFQAVLAKRAPGEARPEEELDHAVRQIISRAVAPEGVVDIFAAAGLQKPDISILSDEFLAEVRGLPQRNLAVELLQKLLRGELANRRRKNVVQARSFAEMLEQTIRRYQNRAIEAAQVIEELVALAREMRDAKARGEALGLSEDEMAFYDALETNDSAVKVNGRRYPAGNRPRAGRDGAQQHHDRLDPSRERPRPNARASQTHPAQARLPAGQAREGDADRPGADGRVVGRLGYRLTCQAGLLHPPGRGRPNSRALSRHLNHARGRRSFISRSKRAESMLPSPWEHKVGISSSILEAQYPAHQCLCLRFGCHLTMAAARLEVRMDRYSFPVGLFHPLQHAGLSRRTTPFGRARSRRCRR